MNDKELRLQCLHIAQQTAAHQGGRDFMQIIEAADAYLYFVQKPPVTK